MSRMRWGRDEVEVRRQRILEAAGLGRREASVSSRVASMNNVETHEGILGCKPVTRGKGPATEQARMALDLVSMRVERREEVGTAASRERGKLAKSVLPFSTRGRDSPVQVQDHSVSRKEKKDRQEASARTGRAE